MVKMMFWDGGGWAWWQAGLMWVAMIAFWCLLIWGIYALITAAAQRAGQPERGADAHRILDERLARGEIGTEEYRKLREMLGSGTGRSTAGSGR
jgi:putative membrane protein